MYRHRPQAGMSGRREPAPAGSRKPAGSLTGGTVMFSFGNEGRPRAAGIPGGRPLHGAERSRAARHIGP